MITIRSAARPLTLLALAVALTACQASPSSSPTPSQVASPTATRGITAEEDQAIHPPAPTDVRAVVTADKSVRITWQTPPAPTVKQPRYSDNIVEYQIYRRGPGEVEMRPVGTSKTAEFVDKAPGTGDFAYTVTAIHDNNVESTSSDPAAEVTL